MLYMYIMRIQLRDHFLLKGKLVLFMLMAVARVTSLLLYLMLIERDLYSLLSNVTQFFKGCIKIVTICIKMHATGLNRPKQTKNH